MALKLFVVKHTQALVILCLWIYEKRCGPTQMICTRDEASTNQEPADENSDEARPLLDPASC